MAASSKLLILIERAASSWSSPWRNTSSAVLSTEQGHDPDRLLLLCDPDGGLDGAGLDPGLLHPVVSTAHAWRPRHGDGQHLLPLARLSQWHRLLHDNNDGGIGSLTTRLLHNGDSSSTPTVAWAWI
jgi:hypothetical protein